MNKIILIFGALFIAMSICLIGIQISSIENEDAVAMSENIETEQTEQSFQSEWIELEGFLENDEVFVCVDALKSPNNELQQYVSSQVEIDETHIRITAEEIGNLYLSGKAESISAYRYGKFSFSVNTIKGDGLFPAIWMLPSDESVGYPEVDIYELIGNKSNIFYGVLHDMKDGEKLKNSFTYEFPVEEIPETYHITFEWTQEEMTWYLEDEVIYTIQENVPDEPMYFIINLAVGGDWPGNPNDYTEFPAMFNVEILEFAPEEIYLR